MGRIDADFMNAPDAGQDSWMRRLCRKMVCPECGEAPDMEIGPDELMPEAEENAVLQKILEGEDVERYDRLLSLAVTGGDFEWV